MFKWKIPIIGEIQMRRLPTAPITSFAVIHLRLSVFSATIFFLQLSDSFMWITNIIGVFTLNKDEISFQPAYSDHESEVNIITLSEITRLTIQGWFLAEYIIDSVFCLHLLRF